MRIIYIILSFLFSIIISNANAQTLNSFYAPTIPNMGQQSWVQGTDAPSVAKTIYTGAARGSKCTGLYLTSSDGTTSHIFTVFLTSPTSTGISGAALAVTIPLAAGYIINTPAIAPMSATLWPGLPTDSDNNRYFYLPSGWSLKGYYITALGSGAIINATAICADFN